METPAPVVPPTETNSPVSTKSKFPKWILLLVAAVGILAVVGFVTFLKLSPQSTPISSQPSTSTKEVNALSLYHWWTSPGESAAINSLFGVFKNSYPDVAIIPAPVSGGAGFQIFPLIQSLVNAGEAPDAFQMHAGYEARPYYDAGLLEPIDALWQSEKLESVIPKVIRDMTQFDNHYYSIPVNVHRVNVVWYNQKLLKQNGIDASRLTTWDSFFAACDKLKAAGVKYPIQMGPTWTASHIFEQILASQGVSFYENFINGKILSAQDPTLNQALTTFKKFLSHVNPDNSTTVKDWDDAIRRIIKAEGAFSIMGDWANGEFKLIGMKHNTDYGTIPVPGTNDMYGLCIDTFQHPKAASHPTNSDRWLKVVASKAGQDAFNPIKGSIPARTDADVSLYDDYQKGAISDFNKSTYMYPSIVHGSGMPSSFKLKLNDIVDNFVQTQDINKAAVAIVNQVQSTLPEFTKVWSLE